MKKNAVIVAGGSGTRMGGGIPKQFRTLCGKPVLWWSIKAFKEEDPDTRIIIVLPSAFINLWKDFYNTLPESHRYPHEIVGGGESRTESVRNGLELIDDEEDSLIAVHDGARPLVKPAVIGAGWHLAEKAGTAIPAVPVTDSLRRVRDGDSEAVDRSEFVAVQTPQVFRCRLLKKAYSQAEGRIFTDDASIVENIGEKIYLYEGDPDNMKVTNPKDLDIASTILGEDG